MCVPEACYENCMLRTFFFISEKFPKVSIVYIGLYKKVFQIELCLFIFDTVNSVRITIDVLFYLTGLCVIN